MMTVDTHAHVFSHADMALSNARYQPPYEALLDDWMACWPKAGVTRGVLVQPRFLGTDNSYLFAQMRRRPQHLRGIIVIDPGISQSELQEAHAAGARGIRLNLIGMTDFREFAGQRWQILFGWLINLGWHLEIQCLGELWPQLLGNLGDMPIPMVVDHFGLPAPASKGRCPGVEAIIRLSAKRHVYVKFSALYRLRNADMKHYASQYLSDMGTDRLLWGSDCPGPITSKGVIILHALTGCAKGFPPPRCESISCTQRYFSFMDIRASCNVSTREVAVPDF